MPRIINHIERKELILREALNVFNEIGIKDTSLALIAERSGVSRPILYHYFSDKSDIFYYAVKLFTDRMYERYQKTALQENRSAEERLKIILSELLAGMIKEKALLGALINYYFELRSTGDEATFRQTIRRRTINFKRLIHKLLRTGEENGEFPGGVTQKTDFLFALCESLFIQPALLDFDNETDLKALIFTAVESLKRKSND
jgi:AcrR family transcriptional regulator